MRLTVDELRECVEPGTPVALATPYGVYRGEFSTIIPPSERPSERARERVERIVIRNEGVIRYVSVDELCRKDGIIIDGRKRKKARREAGS